MGGMYIRKMVLGLALCGGLAACGDTVGEQAIVGGVAGLGTAAVIDGNLLAGAAIGAGANILFCQQNPGKC
jgi:hypothetical protein